MYIHKHTCVHTYTPTHTHTISGRMHKELLSVVTSREWEQWGGENLELLPFILHFSVPTGVFLNHENILLL